MNIETRKEFVTNFFKDNYGSNDNKYSKLVNNDINNIIKRALDYLNIKDNNIFINRPICLLSPAKIGDNNTKQKVIRNETNNKGIYNIYYDKSKVELLFFTKDKLISYITYIDHQNATTTKEETFEVLYKDIITIKTKKSVDSLKKTNYEFIDLELDLISGKTIKFNIRNRFFTGFDTKKPLTEEEQNLISEIKTVIRNNQE